MKSKSQPQSKTKTSKKKSAANIASAVKKAITKHEKAHAAAEAVARQTQETQEAAIATVIERMMSPPSSHTLPGQTSSTTLRSIIGRA